MARLYLLAGAISGFLAVLIGAFAAHGLKQYATPAVLETVKIAVDYQLYHALALLAVGIWQLQKPRQQGLKVAGLAFILGSFLFSGRLYALAAGAPRWLGPITPVGGICFLVGWAALAMAAWRTRPDN